MKTLEIESIGRSPLRRGLLLIPLGIALAWFTLSPQARAGDPPPGGGYWTWIAAGSLNTAKQLALAIEQAEGGNP